MSIKFFDVFTKADWIKIIILLIVAIGCWWWVYIEYQKPLGIDWETEKIIKDVESQHAEPFVE